ncbi:MAG: phage tail tape measure protein [Thermoplasmatales archaeon]|nr:MAG: phage tail tape measure protein [Thermoplasmatales archaeon]
MTNKVTYSFVLLDRFSRIAKKIKSSSKKLTQSLNKAALGFKKVTAKIAKSSGKIREVGKNLFYKVSLPLTLAGANALRMSANFEMAMNNVKALTDATSSDFVKLRNRAKELGQTTKYTATEVADTMGVLAKAGLKTNKILGAISPVLDLATSANLSMASSAEIVTGILAGFQIKVKDLTKVNDVLVQAFTNSKTDLVSLGEAFKYGGSVAKSMGLSLEETSAILATLGKRNIEASMAGTALRGMMTKLVNPTRDAVKIFKKLKIRKKDIVDSKGNLRSLIDIIEILQKRGINTAQTMEVFGLRAGPAMVGLLSEGHKSIRKFVDLLGQAGGKTEKIASVQMKGLTGATRSLMSAFEGLNISVGDTGFLGFATDLTNKLANFVRSISKTDKSTLKLYTIIAGIVALIPVLIILIGMIASPIGLVVTAVSLLSAGLATLILKWKELKKWFVAGALNNWASAIKKTAGIFQSIGEFFGGNSSIKSEIINKQPNTINPIQNENNFSGVLDINLKDRQKQVQSMQLQKTGFLDVGLSRVGI